VLDSSSANRRGLSATKMDGSRNGRTQGRTWRRILHGLVTIIGIFLCYQLAASSAATGISRLFSMVAIFEGSADPTNKAIRLAPNDPEAHYTRALSLINDQRLPEALEELHVSTELRPHHYYEWLDLGVTLDRIGDEDGAIKALNRSIELAPSFAQPRWQLGSLLYRQGRYDEAFAELRLAAASSPSLVRGLLELAWSIADENTSTLERLVQPQTADGRLELAKFLASHSHGNAAVEQVRQAGGVTAEAQKDLLRDTLNALLESQQFSEAWNVWILSHPAFKGQDGQQIVNGDFVFPITRDDPGFGWQLGNIPNIQAAIDQAGPSFDAMSLRLSYSGESEPQQRPIRQLALVEPNSRYKLTFMSRAEDIVSGGPPVLVVTDPSDPTTKLGRSSALNSAKKDWNSLTLDFVTDAQTRAVVIAVERLQCSQSPCPIFGKLWLSRFSLNRGNSN
jgi:Tfp pilus assembly protein PilF